MPFDGSGGYGLPAGTEAVSGTVIDASKYNTFLADLVTALSGSVRRNGESAMTANLPLGGNRLTNVGNAVSAQDAVTKSQLDAFASTFMKTVLDDVDAAAARATLGALSSGAVSAFGLTLVDDPDAATARATLGTDVYKSVPGNAALTAGEMYKATGAFTLNTGAAEGTTYLIYNNTATTIGITQGSGLTLRLAGTTLTGGRSLEPRGMVTVWCVSTTDYVISGAGLY